MVRLLARLKPGWRDAALIVAFFLGGALLTRSVLLVVTPNRVFFYQQFLSAAVLDACGLGFNEYPAERTPEVLQDFVARRTTQLSCENLPTDQPLLPAGRFAVTHRYLAWMMTAIWRIRGVDWHALATLFEIAGGAVAAFGYAIGRLALNRAWTTVLALAVMTSGLNLGYVTWLRDYSKAPFLLASLWLCGWLVTRTRTTRGLVTVCALQGVVIGTGFGFRTDVVVAVPLLLLVVAFGLPRGAGMTAAWRATGLAAFMVAFVLASLPILRGYGQGGNMPHVMLLGLAQPFNAQLGVAPTHYVVNPSYWDFQTEVQVRAYAKAHDRSDWAAVSTRTYDREASAYMVSLATALPADMLLRSYAAVLTVLRMPSSGLGPAQCDGLAGSLAGSACAVRNWLLGPLRWLPLLPAVLSLVIVSASSLRVAGFLCAVLVLYAGTSMLQYDPRHTFHLEIIPLWTLAFAGQHLFTVARGGRRLLTGGVSDRDVRSTLRKATIRALWAATTLLVLPASVLFVVRSWQDQRLTRLFERYEAAPVLPGPMAWVDATPTARGVSLEGVVPPFDPRTDDGPTVRAEILRVDFSGSACAGRDVTLTLEYRTTFPVGGVTEPAVFRWRVAPDGSTTMVFLPVYRALVGLPTDARPSAELLAPRLNVEAIDIPCVQSIRRVVSPRSFPLQLAVAMPADWREMGHYQRLMTLGGPAPAP